MRYGHYYPRVLLLNVKGNRETAGVYFYINLYYSKGKGGNFIYPVMHRFILYYQASERT